MDTVYNMKPKGPRLDKHGFPIPPGFDEAGVEDPSGGRSFDARWLLRLLKVGVVVGLLAALWLHFDLGTRGRELFGEYHAQRAVASYRRGDLDGALAEADRAVEWKPDSVQFLVLRAHLKNERKDYVGVLADASQAIEIKPNDEDAQVLRSLALHYLRRHREAAEAATDMLTRGLGTRPAALNSRAYARALGGFELNEALADIDEALAGDADNSSFLDTRGYIYFKVGRQKEALADLNRAIALVEKQRDDLDRLPGWQPNQPGREDLVTRQLKALEENLAVMHHHRGEVHEKLGNADDAKRDLFIGKELGYDPESGIY